VNRVRARLGGIALAVLLMLGCGAGRAAASAPLHSDNWSGYVAVACGSCKLRYVTATWRQPAISCAKTPENAWAYFWVGLDGWTSGSIEQTGTSGACNGGKPSYFAWYDMYPDNPAVLGSVPVRPGDLITASVYWNASTGRWYLTVSNRTTGASATAKQRCPASFQCGNASAEVVAEAPGGAPRTLPLADFGTVTYTTIAITSRNGTHGAMTDNSLWAVHPINLVGNTGTILASPGPVRGGTAFTGTWHAAQ